MTDTLGYSDTLLNPDPNQSNIEKQVAATNEAVNNTAPIDPLTLINPAAADSTTFQPDTNPKDDPTLVDPKATSKSKTTANKQTAAEERSGITDNVAIAMAQPEAEASALGGDYAKAMAGLDALPNGANTSSPALNADINSVTANEQSAAPALEQAANGISTAGQTLEKDLPYQDVIATALAQKKSELQYGTVPTYSINDSDWSQSLKGIYNYINGTSSTAGSQSSNPDNIGGTQSIKTAAGGGTSPVITQGAGGTDASNTG